MQALHKRLSRALFYYHASIRSINGSHNSLFSHRTVTTCSQQSRCQPPICDLLASPWSAIQLRCARFSGADVRPGNVIERRGKIYEVIKAQHTTQGRGGAIIQVELRDIDSGNKLNERLRTDETVEKVYVKEKSLTYLYTDDETGNVVLMDSETYGQLDVPKHLFGESVVYLQDDMKVIVQLYDERPMSASVPHRVTCTVTEAAEPIKGIGATPHYKKVLLDNGLTIQVPAHILSGDKILVNTTDNSYISKA
ncbi:uncharacterized protein LOC111405849 isoform X2 [Olea europaea var. sylvestris]|uniref:Elongation factor P-like n=1 Tax=Olea europaea subsp. europaea TaxID=158383 RepID=A0A8S0S209_OLEEU|nr:uncharacterized protein LOC111405849 isoform X2 [Olea europaea var. sylvestris]CAA2986465.1 elongation factor P-like [Olea europaea subsp. europaea]